MSSDFMKRTFVVCGIVWICMSFKHTPKRSARNAIMYDSDLTVNAYYGIIDYRIIV